MLFLPEAIYLDREIRVPWENTVLGGICQETKWMCVVCTHFHDEDPVLYLMP